MSETQQPKRIRRCRSLRLQLEAALRDAEACMMATPSDELAIARMKLSQTRLSILNKMLGREQNRKAQRNAEELVSLRAENAQLREQLNVETNRPHIKDVEIAEALERYERSKHVRNENEV
jgi:hypothetical protein